MSEQELSSAAIPAGVDRALDEKRRSARATCNNAGMEVATYSSVPHWKLVLLDGLASPEVIKVGR